MTNPSSETSPSRKEIKSAATLLTQESDRLKRQAARDELASQALTAALSKGPFDVTDRLILEMSANRAESDIVTAIQGLANEALRQYNLAVKLSEAESAEKPHPGKISLQSRIAKPTKYPFK